MKLYRTPLHAPLAEINRLSETDQATLKGDAIAQTEAARLYRERQQAVYDEHEAFLESATPEQLDAYYKSERARQAMLDAGWEP